MVSRYVAGATVDVLRAPGRVTDPFSHGGGAEADVLDWSLGSVIGTYLNVPIAPEGSLELSTPTTPLLVESKVTLYMPYNADVSRHDRVVVKDHPLAGTYEVDGNPAPWQNPFTGATPGRVVRLGERIGG